MKNDAIRRANRKALPKFIAVAAVLLAAGFVLGFLASWYGLNTWTAALKNAAAFFGAYIAPWLTVALAVILPIVCLFICRSAGKMLRAWDGEDEKTADAIERKLSTVTWLTGACLILACFLMAAAYSGGFAIFESSERTALYFVSIAAFLVLVIEMLIIGQKCVDTTKRLNPEKTASFYDMKFQKKWIEDCDEAEKLRIGKCAFKAYAATNRVCATLAVALAVCALLFDTGFLPSLAVCLVWAVNLTVYCREAIRYSKAGNSIS